MNTAEVAIEHVIAGILALCAFALPLLSGLKIDHRFLQAEILVAILGMAYLFGVVFDKVADTALSPIEQLLRLNLTNESLKKKKPYLDDDPFPQDTLEFSLRGDENGRIEWMNSLRSRIRTSRELTVFGLPAAMGVVIYLSSIADCHTASQLGLSWWPHSAVALNLLFLLLSLLISSCKIFKIPKTNELDKAYKERKNQMKMAKMFMLIRFSPYVLVLVNSAVTISIITAVRPENPLVPIIGVCGAVATLFALWAWMNISNTYMKFVYLKLDDLLVGKGTN